MADIALGSVGKIIDIALKIKEAVKNVKRNEKDCHDIERCVAQVTALIKRLDEVTEAMKEEVMQDALEDLAESLEGALDLVTKCQRKHVVRRFIGAGDMAKELRQVQDDILRKVTIGSFATNVVQLGITLMTTNAQAAPAPQRHQLGVGTEKPSRGGHHIIGDASGNDGRYETDQTNKLATGSGVLSIPLSGFTKFHLSELEVATHNFSEENIIGIGGFAQVFKGLLRNGLVVAVKDFFAARNDDFAEATMLFHEMKIGVKLRHKNVVKTLGYCAHEKVELCWLDGREVKLKTLRRILVIGHLPNGSLQDTIIREDRHIYWPFCFRIIQGIAQGLHYLHEQNVVHRDLKPSNILFDSDMNPVIIDFGLSAVLDNEDYIITDNICGTMGYMAPEYIVKHIVSKKYDVFAFGVVIQRTIFRACTKVEFQENRHHDSDFKWDAVLKEGVDKMKDFLDLTRVEESELTEVARCLKVGLLCREYDPADRPTMAEVLDMLNGEKEVPVPARKNKPLSIDSSSGEE